MLTITVLDANGHPVSIPITAYGQNNSANSVSVVLASDQPTLNTYDTSYALHSPVYAQVTVTSTAQLLSNLVSIPSWATMVFITAETGMIRYRADGTSPTSTIGQPIAMNQSWPLQGMLALASAVLISTGGNVTVSIEFRG